MKNSIFMRTVDSIDLILKLADMPDEKKITLICDEIESLKQERKAFFGGFWRSKPKRRADG